MPLIPTWLKVNPSEILSRLAVRSSVRSLGGVDSAAGAYSLSELLERSYRVLPVDAGIRDADTLLESGGALSGDLLVALVDVGLDHDADDGGLTLTELLSNDGGNLGLVAMVLVGVT